MKLSRMKRWVWAIPGLLLLQTGIFAPIAFAALPCGAIVAPGNFFNQSLGDETIQSEQIVNCADPFEESTVPPSPYTLMVDGQEVVSGGAITVPVGGTSDVVVEGVSYHGLQGEYLFKHEGEEYIYQDRNAPEITPEQFSAYIPVYFENSDDLVLYQEILTIHLEGGDTFEYFNDIEGNKTLDSSGAIVEERFWGFFGAAESALAAPAPMVRAGTYTMVIKESEIILSQNTWQQKLQELFIKTAHAEAIAPNLTYTITFTINEGEPVVGASSVLFLPGIQSSRLYKDGLLGTEDQLWEPNINGDLEQLAMDENGISVNEVYTKDVLDEIFGFGNVYRGFLNNLEELKQESVIKDFLPFAYDWRYSVDDVVTNGTQYEFEIKNVLNELELLAADSYTGKVTIIGHSNGGLFAKALMLELESQGKENLVDKVVFVGTPQVGTPKAIGAILHGLDQQAGGGVIIDDVTARDVMKNMAGPYGLLPSEMYFELVDDTLISQDQSSSTEYLDEYGEISSYTDFTAFLKDTQESRLIDDSINVPGAVNQSMLDDAVALHAAIDAWQAPADIRVFEVAGIGLPTIKSFQYKEFSCSPYFGGLNCLNGKYSKPYPIFTTYGDETVVASSAVAYGGTKVTAQIDLIAEGADFFIRERSHSNLTESPTVQAYLDSIIKFKYQNETLEIPQEFTSTHTIYKVIGVHSPVNILISNTSGGHIGVQDGEYFDDIPGGYYFTLGDSKYVIVPDNEYDVEINGYATSTFSLTVDVLEDGIQTSQVYLTDLPTGTQMKAEFRLSDAVSDVLLDINGDGVDDLRIDSVTGQRTELSDDQVAESTRVDKKSGGTRIQAFNYLTPGALTSATISTSYDEEYYKLVMQLLKLIEQYLLLKFK